MTTVASLCPAFHGDGRAGEDSKSWFKTFRRSTVEWDDAKKLANFDLYLENDAEKWWESSAGVACHGSWVTAAAGFLAHFPSIPEPQEGRTVQFERLTGCVLTRAELGGTTWDETKKKEVPNHTAWAQKIVRLAGTYGDTAATTLPFIRVMCVPKLLDELLADDYASYTEYAQAVGNVKLEKLRSVCEAADTIDALKVAVTANQKDAARLQTWAPKPNYPTNAPPLPRSYAAATMPVTPTHRFGTPGTLVTPTNVNSSPQTPHKSNPFRQTPQTSARSPFDHDPAITPRNNITIAVGPFPETPEGWRQHTMAVTAWNVKWGEGTFPAPDRPYPLSPGTAAIGTRECFRCGRRTDPPHSTIDNSCTHTHVNITERNFRARYRFGLNGNGDRQTPPHMRQNPTTPSPQTRTPAPVHQISSTQEMGLDYDTIYGAFPENRAEEQGNERGPSG